MASSFSIRSETLTLVLVNLAGIMERADQSLLPGVYNEVGAALHADPTRLGSLTLFRSIVQTLCYPLAAYLAVRHNRAHVIALGAFLWSAATFLVAFSSTFFQVAVSRGLNGIGLALVIPAIQSLVADSTEDHNRGTAFGWLFLTGNIGSILGNICSVLIAPTTVLGIPGWRVSFHLIGAISVVVGILVRLFATDPHFDNDNDNDDGKKKNKTRNIKSIKSSSTTAISDEISQLLKEAKSVIKIPTFQILIAQGVLGSFPWSALSFLPMWFELLGFTHDTTALLMTVFVTGSSIGGLMGGKMGDVLAARFPNAGRILLSQISAGSVAPMAAILLLALPTATPPGAGGVWSYGSVLFVMGLLSSWNAPATNNPIFAEIVPEKHRTSIYALDQSLESILASFAPPIVGILAQNMYGYKPTFPPPRSKDHAALEDNRADAASLAKALYTSTGAPIVMCTLIYSLLYWSYPRDRDRAKMQALIDEEIMNILEKEDDDNNDYQYELGMGFTFNKLDNKETNDDDDAHQGSSVALVDEIVLGSGDQTTTVVVIDDDDNDEKRLLP